MLRKSSSTPRYDVTVQPKRMIPGDIKWPGGPSIQQKHLSLPYLIIDYMAKNPSSTEVYNKLIQCCKHFYEKNPILVVKNMNENGISSTNGSEVDEDEYFVDMDIQKIKSKIWLTDVLSLWGVALPNFTVLCSKLYRCNLSELFLGDMNVLFDDFKYLALTVKGVELNNVKMTYKNGKPVMLERILEALPKVEDFYYDFPDNLSVTTASTIKNIAKLQNLGNLTMFSLGFIPEVFDVEELSAYMKDHKYLKFVLDFKDNISREYMDQLETLIDTIILSDIFYRIIMFNGQDHEKLKILESRNIDQDDDEDMDALFEIGSDIDMIDIDLFDDVDEMEDIFDFNDAVEMDAADIDQMDDIDDDDGDI
uniref:Uncharacterized protein n=1 Tax=Panagrolaimus sp. PS1159 TaxID=55785 RepID=A0AC35FI44_9BILA